MIVTGWIVSGLIGAWLSWLTITGQKTFKACPSPLGLLLIAIVSAFGPMIFGASIALCIICGLIDFFSRDSWWTRPMCGGDE